MSFLPVTGRELRVSARDRRTFWLRVATGSAAALLLFLFYVFARVTPSGVGFKASWGPVLFRVLTWLALSAGLSFGLFFTSDCLSEEKREGTIGLLFLTDLRGYDVVLGKLLATSLRAFYAMLAVFPILGITFVMGGVTGVQFWRAALGIVNAIFVSLTAGLFISALSRNSQNALLGTIALMAAWIGLGPLADGTAAAMTNGRWSGLGLSLSSPGYLLFAASSWGTTPFWWGLLINQGLMWLLLSATCLLLPHTWQERGARSVHVAENWRYRWRFGTITSRHRLRDRLLEANPICWLIARERWQSSFFWSAAGLLTLGLGALGASERFPALSFLWNFCSGTFLLFLYLGTAVQAVRFGVETRRSGMMELLLVGPLTVPQIVQGQWRAAGRLFGWPLVLCLVAQLVGTLVAQDLQWKQFKLAIPAAATNSPVTLPSPTSNKNSVIITFPPGVATTSGSTNATVISTGGFVPPGLGMILSTSACGTLTLLANLVALFWFGMWLGLTSKTTNQGSLRTLLWVQVIPWFLVTFASGILISLIMMPMIFKKTLTSGGLQGRLVTWYPFLMGATALGLCLAKDTAFCLWARRKLYYEFRTRASFHSVPTVLAAPVRPPPLPPVLPVVTAESPNQRPSTAP